MRLPGPGLRKETIHWACNPLLQPIVVGKSRQFVISVGERERENEQALRLSSGFLLLYNPDPNQEWCYPLSG